MPGACATCGYSDSAPSGGSNDFRDWITCADAAYELMVLFGDCTGVCVDAAGKATLEGMGFADLDDSACVPYRACYDDETFLDTFSLGGTNTNYLYFSYSYDVSEDHTFVFDVSATLVEPGTAAEVEAKIVAGTKDALTTYVSEGSLDVEFMSSKWSGSGGRNWQPELLVQPHQLVWLWQLLRHVD